MSVGKAFEGRGQLLIYHFMFDPDQDEGCESCSFLADGIGYLAHLHARDTAWQGTGDTLLVPEHRTGFLGAASLRPGPEGLGSSGPG